MASAQPAGLNVIALVSGGKDSFFSLLHCRANGHRVVALANLHPALPPKLGPCDATSHPRAATISAAPAASAAVSVSAPALDPTPAGGPHQGPDRLGKDGRPPAVLPGHDGGAAGNELVPAADEDERDLNSFMYQTVGHQVIPLYAEATGIPLYRRAITGGATQHGKDYSHHRRFAADGSGAGGYPGRLSPGGGVPESGNGTAPEEEDPDETESMVPLLQAVKKAHPEANAICAGAILSTYQRTRVESVATRLELTPLAYLWKYPVLPTPAGLLSDPIAGPDAQLLDDMAAAGVEARIIKVASGGLDDAFLWTNVASAAGKGRLARAMRRFGAAETGAVIGEGGEFETLVLDGPAALFKKRIVVDEEDRTVVREGGGSAWLSLRNARLEDKGEQSETTDVRIPELLDPKFVGVMDALSSTGSGTLPPALHSSSDSETTEEIPPLVALQASASEKLQQWSFVGSEPASVEAETRSVVEQIRQRLRHHALPASAILSATVVLRRMADFPAVNSIYGTLFDAPNPPSRVTISCGDAAHANIAVYLTVHTALQPTQRQGLHVQSRSYWAPANIGPYSQATSIPVASLGSADPGTSSSSSSGARLVTIAGQIPLVPATMALPSAGSSRREEEKEEDTLPLQLSLSLQHLWRIGLETGVQWWTSAVAYFPAAARSCSCTPGEEMASKARLAAAAWRAVHASNSKPMGADDDEEGDEEDGGPDLWDRRYNPQYMTFSGGGGYQEKKVVPALPDRSVLLLHASSSQSVVPPVFVAEVEELPRGAGVEWHAHLGVAHAAEGSVMLRAVRRVTQAVSLPGGEGGREVAVFVQTVVAEGFGGGGGGCPQGGHGEVLEKALAELGGVGSAGVPGAVVRYVDAEVLRAGGEREGDGGAGPVVPCRSLWDGEGGRLAALTVYQSVFE
ncbi:hypothetical protein C8A01DRAFT_14254 [Parachaetomium inaequale]|uniref:Diphthine--ammonia ligase n=1 Tax=Parachaetomium inaequale TaxID=2588326 RepID=A0AAN6PNK2_9PEZI|nr:hypothetical protein C8A01DRAFT_14254 [Parachaetomium inaequale]